MDCANTNYSQPLRDKTKRRGAMGRKNSVAPAAGSAFAFVLTMGFVNLFSDITYEGGAGINGQFLGSLGVGAAAVSMIAGVGEFLGYSLRSVAGYLADRSGRYWLVRFVGYAAPTSRVRTCRIGISRFVRECVSGNRSAIFNCRISCGNKWNRH